LNIEKSISRYLFVFDLVLCGLALNIAVVMGVVCIIYAVYLDASPRLAQELSQLINGTLIFFVGGLVFAANSWSLHRQHASRWLLQIVSVACLAASIGYIIWLR